MAKLAIKGHATRGKEVIELLEMMGGKNIHNSWGVFENRIYTIDEKTDEIIDISKIYYSDYNLFTLEKFLEKFPYKVGDKVNSPCKGCIKTITSMEWDTYLNTVTYKLDNRIYTNIDQLKVVNDLQPYEEETMEENTDVAFAPDLKGEDYSGRRFGYKIPKGYEFECVRNNEIILKPIKPQYPKTYEECCKVLNIPSNGNIAYVGNWVYGGEYLEKHLNGLRNFQQLLICRDAYWKLSGEQMGLGKPWKFENPSKCYVFTIENFGGIIQKHAIATIMLNRILVFPTAEMRDAFYENFKDSIEQCKELL